MADPVKSATDQFARRFLCLCLGSRWNPAALSVVRELAIQEEVSWGQVARLAADQKLIPLLYDTLRGKELVPAPVEERWRPVYYDSIRRSTRLFHQLTRVLQDLREAQCPVLLLKGAALAETVYGDAALRPMVDLDLLVPASRVPLAETILGQLGYRAQIPDPWPGYSQRYRNSMAYVYAPVHESGYPIPWMVGLHWRLLDVPYHWRIQAEEWFARGQPARVAAVDALVPTREDHLVYLCGHLAVHHRYDPALLRYYDMAGLIHLQGEGLDWDTVLQRTVDWRLVIPLQRSLARLEKLWPGTVPTEAVQAVGQLQPTWAERAVHRWVTDRPRNAASDTLLSLATLPGVGRRARFLLEAILPSPDYMRQRYCPRRPWLWPLAYLLRAGTAVSYLIRRLT